VSAKAGAPFFVNHDILRAHRVTPISALTIQIEWGQSSTMRKSTSLVAAFVAIAGGAYADSELVIASGYLQAKEKPLAPLFVW
jgi:hypothetical protein